MDTQDIALIRIIAETGSLTKAAKSLYMSQPTLSKKLARIESQLNTTLFHRSPRGLIPTSVTNYIIAEAEPLNAQLARIERHVEQLNDLETGVIRLGVGPIIEQVLLPDVLKRFVERTGDIRISIITDDADKLLDQLNHAKLDVIAGPFRAEDFNIKEHTALPLTGDPIIQVARSHHPLFDAMLFKSELETPASQAANAERYPLAAPRVQGSVTREPVITKPEGHRKTIVCDNYALLKNLTQTTDCICAGPERLFAAEIEANLLKRIPNSYPILEWQSACITRPESLTIPLVKLLIEIFIEVNEMQHPDINAPTM